MAPNIVGSNCITRAEDDLARFIASLVSWQGWLGVSDESSALQRITIHDMPETDEQASDTLSDAEYDAIYPQCLIRQPQGVPMFGIEQAALDYVIQFNLSLRYVVTFEAEAQPGLNAQDQARYFLNSLGSVVEEIAQTAGQNDWAFAPTSVAAEGPMYRTAVDQRSMLGDVIGFSLLFERVIQ